VSQSPTRFKPRPSDRPKRAIDPRARDRARHEEDVHHPEQPPLDASPRLLARGERHRRRFARATRHDAFPVVRARARSRRGVDCGSHARERRQSPPRSNRAFTEMFKRAVSYARASAERARRRKKEANAVTALEVPRLDDFREEQNATRFVQRHKWLSINVGAFPVRRLSLARETRYSRARARHRSRPRDARANGDDGTSGGDDSSSILSAVGNRRDEMDDE